ncbi:MAG: hypothetical protein H7Y43_11960, partial [Akkermansiaceae bacterium]|nr:hypothetical protein [Verrucomicrobiales bacterium]
GQYYGTNIVFQPAPAPGALPDSLGLNDGFVVKYHADGQLAGRELRISRTGGGAISVEWIPGDGVRLQRATSLGPSDWQDIPTTLGDGSFNETVTNGAVFFRLLSH